MPPEASSKHRRYRPTFVASDVISSWAMPRKRCVAAVIVALVASCAGGCGRIWYERLTRDAAVDATRPDGAPVDATFDGARQDGTSRDAAVDGAAVDAAMDAGCDPGSCALPAWRWDRAFGSSSDDEGRGMAVDGAGNAVVTGLFTGTVDLGGGTRTSAGARGVFVVSYGPDGRWRWDRSFGDGVGTAIAVDDAGNAVVTGFFNGTMDLGGGTRTSAGGSDVFVVSYGPDGSWRWDRSFGGVAFDAGRGLTVDGAGNAVVTGSFQGTADFGGGVRTSAGDADAFVVSYDPDGSWRWDRSFGGASFDQGHDVAVDGDGNVVVTGGFEGVVELGGGARTSTGLDDVFVASYGPDGSWRWDRTFGSTSDHGHGVAVDGAGNAVVTGRFAGTVDLGGGARTGVGGADVFIASYGPDGEWRWDRTLGSASGDGAWGVAVDGAGNAVVTGQFEGTMDLGGGARTSASGLDAFVASYGPDGSWRWDRTFGGGAFDRAFGVAMDVAGNAVVTGLFEGTLDLGGGARTSAGGTDVFVLQLGCACP